MEFARFCKTYDLQTLDSQQRAAVQAVQGPVLLLAVPGSGKTTTLLARLGYLILGCGVPPEQILTCTYTVAATAELRTRFAARFGPELAARTAFRTINGVCASILSLYERTGHQAFRLITDESVLRGLLRDIWLGAGYAFPTEGDLRSVATAISYVKNSMLTAEEADAYLITTGEGQLPAGPFVRKYNELMQKNGWMDYDDQLRYALAILRREPDILHRLQARWRYFCVDEAQDTSLIQHRILALLAGRSRNLLMVGDEDQSIYGFRAACPDALLRFEQDWPGATVLLMEQNYRSTPEIVTAADRFIRLNSARRAKNMHPHQPPGPPVEILRCTNRLRQYELLAEQAAEAHRTGAQTAILYRNNDTALPLIDALTRRGIPYRARAVDGLFFSSRVLRDVRAIFAFANAPCDKAAFLQAYPVLSLYLKRQAVNALRPRPGQPILQAALAQLELPEHTRDTLRRRMRQLDFLRAGPSAAAAIRCIAQDMGYRKLLEEKDIDPFRLDILTLLAEKETTAAALFRRLEELEAIIRQGADAPDAPVILSTIHSSKGLEYDRVILADAIEGVLPASLPRRLGRERREALMEEERRLFYVGMTRARRQLTLMEMETESMPFVEWFDPRLRRPAPQPSPRTAATVLPGATITAQVQPAFLELSLDAFVPGSAVRHKKFGRGVLQSREGDRAVILFDGEQAPRTLSLPVAVRGGGLAVLQTGQPAAESEA